MKSSINTFIASFDTEYDTDTIGGNEPVVIAYMDARPDKMLITRGSEVRRSNGSRAVVRTAADVTFALKWSLYVLRRSSREASGLGMFAIAALLMSTFRQCQTVSRTNEVRAKQTIELSMTNFDTSDSSR
jgi:hypothetical protein